MAARLSTDEQHAFTRARAKAHNKQPVNHDVVLTLVDTIARLARELRATEKVEALV